MRPSCSRTARSSRWARHRAAAPGATVVDGTGKFVTPGLIDTHSHIGVYAAPGTPSLSDGNESHRARSPAQVWAEHSFWPQDPQIPLAIAGGVTVIQALPGSANLIGGRSATLRLIPARTVQEMKYPGAPYGLKMACGENPKRVHDDDGPGHPHGQRGRLPGRVCERRRNTSKEWDDYLEDPDGEQPDRDLNLETLVEVLRGRILVQNHCYRADEMAQMLDLGREFGFRIRSFHHAVEAYKIADLLARDSVASSVWSDWWGFKMESLDGIPENAALLQQAGARAIIHSDSADGIQRLNQEAAQGDVCGTPRRHRGDPRAGDPLDHRESGVGARHRQHHRHAGAGQGGRRGDLVGRSVLGLHQGGAGLQRRAGWSSTGTIRSDSTRPIST